MEKRRFPKKTKKPLIPYKPIKGIIAKKILFEQIGEFCKNGKKGAKPFKLDLLLSDLLEELPPGVYMENVHILIESTPAENGNCNFAFTLYAPETLNNPNFAEDMFKYNEEAKEYEKDIKVWKKEKNLRRKEIKEIIKYEEKPRRSEIEDEAEIPIKIKIKNKDVK